MNDKDRIKQEALNDFNNAILQLQEAGFNINISRLYPTTTHCITIAGVMIKNNKLHIMDNNNGNENK